MHQMQCDSRTGLSIRLYDAAIKKIDSAIQFYDRSPGAVDGTLLCLKAAEIVHAIQLGLDLSQGDVPNNVNRLCEFATHEILSRDKDRLLAARRVLATLLSGYQAVQTEADEYERNHLSPLANAMSLVDATC